MDGEPFLIPTDRDPGLRHRGIDFYDPVDPALSAERRACAVSLLPSSLVFVPSLGLGYGLARLLARLPADCAILCVEVDQSVMALAEAKGLPDDPRLAILRTEREADVARALRLLGPHRFRRIITAPLCAGYRLAPGRYQALGAALERELESWWRNHMTLIALGARLVRNILLNLPLLSRAHDATGLATELPVVVAGAGPSLDAAVPILGKLRPRYVLVAADTALPSLAAHGIAPDLVVCLEAQQANLADFLGPRGPDIALACELAASPGAARLFADRLWWYSSDFAPIALLARLESAGIRPLVIPPLGSVGVVAAYLALRMTGSSLFLCGLDFSFPGLRSHARGSPHHLAALAASSRLAPVDLASFAALSARPLARRQGGKGPVATDRVMLSYRDSLSRLLIQDSERTGARRVFELAAEGLPLPDIAVGEEEFASRLSAFPERPGRRLSPPAPAEKPGRAIREFLAGEGTLIAEGSKVVSRMLGEGRAGTPSAEERTLLGALDYAWVSAAEVPDLASLSTGFLARLDVSLRFYRERMERALSLLD